MNAADRELAAIVSDEADRVRPPLGAKERGWARLVATLPDDDGGGPTGAAPLSAPPVSLVRRTPWLKAAPLVGLMMIGALGSWVGRSEPAIVEQRLADAPESTDVFSSPITLPFAPEPSAAEPDPSVEAAVPIPTPEGPAPKRPRAARPNVETDEDDFAAELRLLAAGQAAIQSGELREGLALLRTHRQRYPRGHFAQERDALIAIARCEGGQSGALAAGQKFMQANPDSIHAERVRSACAL